MLNILNFKKLRLLVIALTALFLSQAAHADALDDLARDFWA